MPKDKALHFFAGLAIAAFASAALSPLTGLVMGVAFGAGKELHDYLRPEEYTSDWLDFVATAAGAAVGAALLWQI